MLVFKFISFAMRHHIESAKDNDDDRAQISRCEKSINQGRWAKHAEMSEEMREREIYCLGSIRLDHVRPNCANSSLKINLRSHTLDRRSIAVVGSLINSRVHASNCSLSLVTALTLETT